MAQIPHTPRVTREFNRDWLFCYDAASQLNEERAASAHTETDFYGIALPHTWHTFETTGQIHPFTRDPSECDNAFWWYGWGWYRKHFTIDKRHQGRRIFLEFDGVQKYCRIYCNGVLVGEHKGGYTSFSFELTDHINWEQENTLSVAVCARRDDEFGNIPPMMAGNFNVYGGIYRGVRLVITDSVYIPFQGSATHEGGVFITTPQVSHAQAKLQIIAHVRNASTLARTVQVTHRVLDAAGKITAQMEASLTLAAGEQSSTQQSTLVASPQLWSTSDPYLYEIETTISDENGVLDTHVAPLGFRWFRWDYEDNSFWLNDEKIHIHGTNRHQEYPWLGDALPQWLHQSDLDDIHFNLGHNFIRFCHYTQDKSVYEYCDRHGILVCEEVPCIKNLPFGREAQKQQVVEMIRRDRNHPCIVMWSMGNETNSAADSTWALQEDNTRIIHHRHVQGIDPEGNHTHKNLDMENLLRCTIRGWPARAAMTGDNVPIPEDNEHGQVTGSEDWQAKMACVDGASLRGRIDKNIVVWIYADHGADREYRDCPLKHVNPKGWVDAYRQPKYMYYLWQAHYARQLMAFAQAHWWQPEYIGERHDITVYSNGEEVELFIGDKLFATARPNADNFSTATFSDVPISDTSLRLVAKRANEVCEHNLPMAATPVALRLTASHNETTADRAGIVLLTVDVIDARGNAVVGARPTLSWEIEGPGTLLAPTTFESEIGKREEDEGTFYITTPVVMPVRSTQEAGTIRVTVCATELQAAQFVIRSVAPPSTPDDGIIEFLAATGDTIRRKQQQKIGAAPIANGAAPIRIIHNDQNFQGRSREEVEQLLAELIGTGTLEHHNSAAKILLTTLADIARESDGILIADDFNFHVSQFNRQISNP